jgi:hypothetical protein
MDALMCMTKEVKNGHSIVADELFPKKKVEQRLRKKRHFTISELSEEFPQTSNVY